jgi:hypothetical protein
MRNRLRCLLLFTILAATSAHAADTGSAIKADEIKAEPFRDAKTIGQIASGDKVDILGKNGGWLQIKMAKGSGWVKMLSIRRGAARQASAGSPVSDLSRLASGRAGTGRVVATTGVRGLNEEELKSAKFNEAEVKLAESYSTSRADAAAFAAKGKLVAQSVDYLPAPASSSGEMR